MAEVPREGVVESRDVFPDEITKEDVRPYFTTIDCSLRVLGSQFGLDPGKLTDLERSAQSSSDLRERILEECFKQEKITSWYQFVTVLEKPALSQKSIADDVRRRFSSVGRQVSMDSAASSSTASITTTTPMSPLSSMEISGSFSSSVGAKTGRIELCDAVNEIMKVSYNDLHKLGKNLGLDDNRVQELLKISQTHDPYQLEEKRQRLIEMWFRKELEPTWEMLYRALSQFNPVNVSNSSYLGESSTSMDSSPVIPRSSSTELLMLKSNLEEIKSRFSDLLISVRYALEANNVQVDDLCQMLFNIFDLDADDCIPGTNLVQIFKAVSARRLWDYIHHSPVEKLVKHCLRGQIISEVNDYKKCLSGFYATTKLINFIRTMNFNNDDTGLEPCEVPLRRYDVKDYRMLRVKLKMQRSISEISLKYVQDLWNSFAEEFELPSLTAILDKVLEGCLEITWLIPPREAKQMAASAPMSTSFFRHNNIIFVYLDGCIIYEMGDQESEQATLSAVEGSGPFSADRMSVSDSIIPQELPTHRDTSQHLTFLQMAIADFESRFTYLLAKTKAELVQLRKPVDKVYMLLKTLSGKDFHKYVFALRRRPPNNFDELFDDLNSYRWNCFEYELLEAVIKRNNCSSALRKEIEHYAEDIKIFKRYTPVSKVCKLRRGFLKRKSPLKGYKKLTTKVNADPHNCMLIALDPLSEKVQSELKIPLHLYSMEIGSIVVDWRFSEEHEYMLIIYLCSEHGRNLLEQCEISEILIDDIPLDHSLLFLMAASREDWERVDALLQDKSEDIDLDYTITDGQTALFHVVMKGQERVDLVEKILEQGANPNVQDADGWTPLMKAVEAGNVQMVAILLQRQCNINIQEYVRRLYTVQSSNNIDLMCTVTNFCRYVCMQTRGWSVLHITANKGKTEILEILTNFTSEYEIDFTLKDKEGKNVLQIAEEKQHSDIVKLLTELMRTDSEMDITHKDEEERDSEDKEAGMQLQQLEVASDDQEPSTRTGVWKRLKQRLQRNAQDIKLNRAAIRGSLPDVQKALDNRADPNCITNLLTQKTPLMEASERGHTEVVKFLLSKDADPTKVTTDNHTALSLASKRGHVETVEVLLSTGLPYDVVNKTVGFWKWTALHSICFRRGYEKQFTKEEYFKRMERIVELLIKHGADPFKRDRTGDTALTFASFRGYMGLVKVLVENTPAVRQKELIDHQRNDNWSALLLASRHGHTEVVRYLLEKGASMTISNKAKMTALHLGVSGGHVETVKELAENADPSAINAIDGHGYTPLFIATKLKSLKLVEVLAEAGADPNILTKKEKTTPQRYAAKLKLVAISNVLSQRQYVTSERIQKHANVMAQAHQREDEEAVRAQTLELNTQV